MFNYIHRCGNSEAIETAAEEESWLCLLVSNVFHNGCKTHCCEIFASEHSGGRVRRSACQAESTPNFTYCLSAQKSLCLFLFVVRSTEIRRQLHVFSQLRNSNSRSSEFLFALLPNHVCAVPNPCRNKRYAGSVHRKQQIFL